MEAADDPLAMAERHVREAEARIARQEETIAEMDRDDHPRAAATGREVLEMLRKTRDLMRGHLESLRAEAGRRPGA